MVTGHPNFAWHWDDDLTSPWDDDHKGPEGEAYFIIVIKGNHPQIAELFKLVKYDKLPRLISISIVLRINSHFVTYILGLFASISSAILRGGSQNRVSPKSLLFHDWMILDSPHIFIYSIHNIIYVCIYPPMNPTDTIEDPIKNKHT